MKSFLWVNLDIDKFLSMRIQAKAMIDKLSSQNQILKTMTSEKPIIYQVSAVISALAGNLMLSVFHKLDVQVV